MRVRIKKPVWVAALAVSFAAVDPMPATSQNLHNMIPSEGRVFPQVNGGIIAMREDSSGRFYILANPGHVIQIFEANGTKLGQIPAAGSSFAQFKYAGDFDIAANGEVVVADRGANTIYTFAADGSLKSKASVFAPTSVVALSNGQIAVTTLRTQHPIEIFDGNGRYVRGFGEPHVISNPSPDEDDTAAPPPLADTGRIIGDSADNLYFGILSATDPEIKKFDRFGYAAFASQVPFEPDLPGGIEDRFQLGFNFMRLTASNQISTWTTLGESGKMQFGTNVGMGLAGMMSREGHGYGARGRDNVVGTVTVETSLVQPMFGMHLGLRADNRGGRGLAGSSGAQGAGQSQASGDAAKLQYFAPGTYSSSNDSSSSDSADDTGAIEANGSATALQYQPLSPSANDPSGLVPNTLNYMVGTPQFGPGAGAGGFSRMFLGHFGPRPGGYGHPLLGPADLVPGGKDQGMATNTSSTSSTTSALGTNPLTAALSTGAGSTKPSPLGAAATLGAASQTSSKPDEPGRARFGRSDMSYVGSLRINLDRPRPPTITSKKLTAVGVDRQTQEFWAAIGPELVHFDKYGNPMDTYYMTTPDGALLQIASIVIEPRRLVIGSSSGGVYAFARPDKTAAENQAQNGAKAGKNPTQ